MKIWVLILIAAVLFALVIYRERFETSTTAGSAKKSGYDDVLKQMGQSVDYQKAPQPAATQTTSSPAYVRSAGVPTPTCPNGFRLSGNKCKSIAETEPPANQYGCRIPGYGYEAVGSNGKCSTYMDPSCGGGYTFKPGRQTLPSCEASGGPPGGGNTAGGSSTSSSAPNSGNEGIRRKQVFGPLFTSIGDGANVTGSQDSSKTNQYPELIGGGVAKKSKPANVGMPSTAGLGSDEDSKYLPTSRVPGDMEKIPDPWRVSQSFSASNYSFKTDPVPFLTDFSAFQK